MAATFRDLLLVGILALPMLGIAKAAASLAPDAPSDLRARAYSETAGSIAWSRSTTAGSLYSVRRDGRLVLDAGDRLSLVESDLEPGRSYVYEVIAIAPDGSRSSPARVVLTTPGVSPNPLPDPRPEPPGESRPDAPSGVRLARYSATAAELFWDRPPAAARVRATEVRRDGAVLALTEGNSFFDDTREPGQPSRYELVAIDADGNRSPPTLFDPSTPEPPGESRPDAPSGVRLARYSATAAELFWDRPPATARVRATEVRRDGAILALTEGNSFFDDTREPGRPSRYELVAIDAAGNRSPPTLFDPSTPEPPGESRPDAPSGVRLARYSATAAELFWDRPPATARVRATEVRRDGAVLALVEGNSFFDDTREPGQPSRYELVAIDTAGNRSEPTRFTGHEPPVEPVTAPPEVLARLDKVFAIINGDALEVARAALARLFDSPDVVFGNIYFDRDVERSGRRYFCRGGGGVENVRYQPEGATGTRERTRLESCRFDDVLVSGLFIVDEATPPSLAGREPLDSFSVEAFRLRDERDGSAIALSGAFEETISFDGLARRSIDWRAAPLAVRGTAGEYEAESFDTRTRFEGPGDGTFSATLETTLRARLGTASGDTVVVTTPIRFERPVDGVGPYTRGVLSITGDDHVYRLDADNGNPVSFRLDITRAGSVTSHEVPWSAVRGFDPFTVDAGTLGGLPGSGRR